MKRRVVLLGPPGSGKGTVAEKLEAKFGLEHISTGQWFRREMNAGTALGEHVRGFIERGALVPDDVVLGLMEHWVTPELIEHGFLLDGFPRTRNQAEKLDDFCEERKAPLQAVLYLDCAEEVLLERMTGRRTCPHCGRVFHVRSMPPKVSGVCDQCGSKLVQRSDDKPEVVSERLHHYREITEPVVDYYRGSGKMVSLNAALGSESAFVNASQVLES